MDPEDDMASFKETVVDVQTLMRWNTTINQNNITTIQNGKPQSAFPYDPDLNKRVILWVGDISSLNADAIVNSTNESLNEPNPVSARILLRAGPGLMQELMRDIKVCRTGEVQLTHGHNLPARHVIHTVGPKYNAKYETAAQSTLHCCYRNVLIKACEISLSSVALCVIHSVRKGFPPDEGAHIALRTVRRFLEQPGSSSLSTVIFCVEPAEAGIYEVLMPLYFPRSPNEEQAARRALPSDIGGFLGEPIFPDRQIRIIDNPQHSLDDEGSDLATRLETSVNIGELSFSQMTADPDRQRLLGARPGLEPGTDVVIREVQQQERFDRLLRRARSEDLSEISGIGCLYQCGVDRLGRPVIVFVGKWFRFDEINLDKAMLYFIYLLDKVVRGDYVIIYFHTMTSSSNHPSFSWLREVYSVLPYRFRKHLKSFYIIHPTLWTKMMTWWFTTFMAPQIKQKVQSLPGLEYLYSVIEKDQLEIPAFINEYDMTINGIGYFNAASY